MNDPVMVNDLLQIIRERGKLILLDLGTHKIIRYPQSWDKARCDAYAKSQGLGDVELFHLPMTELPWWGHIRGVPHSPQPAAPKN